MFSGKTIIIKVEIVISTFGKFVILYPDCQSLKYQFMVYIVRSVNKVILKQLDNSIYTQYNQDNL